VCTLKRKKENTDGADGHFKSGMLSYSEALEYEELQGIENYDVLKNPRYKMAFSDREYIPADDSSDEDGLSEGR
jgi:hypothetical protein